MGEFTYYTKIESSTADQKKNILKYSIRQLLTVKLRGPWTKQKRILTAVSKASDHRSHSTQTSMSHNAVLLCSKTLEAF